MEPSECDDRWKQTSRQKGFLTYHAAMNRRSIAPLLLTLIGSVFMSSSLPAENEDLKPYPEAEEGYERYVFRLPKLENEEGLRLNLIVGKTLQLDTINRYFFSGKGERKSIPGWGYSYYHVKEVGPMAGTRAAAPPDAPKVERFVSLSQDWWVRYNSKLPVVVIVPKGFEVRYQVWKPEETKKASVE